MSIPKHNLKQVPKGSFVIRVKKTNKYIHVDDNCGMFVKEKMTGCLVLRCIEDADNIIKFISDLEIEAFRNISIDMLTKYETIPFEEAYETHGVIERIEKQMVYN